MTKLLHYVMYALLFLPLTTIANDSAISLKKCSHTEYTECIDYNSDQLSQRVFCVDIPTTGWYYMEAWILPASTLSKTILPVGLYVNGSLTDRIKPETTSWHGMRPTNNGRIYLDKGINIISFEQASNLSPMVESIRLSESSQEVLYDNSIFNQFVEDIKNGHFPDDAEEISDQIRIVGGTTGKTWKMTAAYTYTTFVNAAQGESIDISTYADVPHYIDIVYYGTAIRNPITGTSTKWTTSGRMPSSQEIQGLNWQRRSVFDYTIRAYKAMASIEIPKTGRYLIRVRPSVNNMTGTADVQIGRTLHSSVPITHNEVRYDIPTNETYSVMTRQCGTATDPMVFVHGADADRIVGFNDDANAAKQTSLNLSATDAYLAQQYSVKATAISVSSFSSSRPMEDIYLQLSPTAMEAALPRNPSIGNKKREILVAKSSTIPEDNSGIDITYIVGDIDISSTTAISEIVVYDSKGLRVYKRDFAESNIRHHTVSMSDILDNRPKGIVVVLIVKTKDSESVTKLIQL